MKHAVEVLSQRLSEVLPTMGTTDMDPLILDGDDMTTNSSGTASSSSVLPVPSTAVQLHPAVQRKHQRVGLCLQVIGAVCLSFMAVQLQSVLGYLVTTLSFHSVAALPVSDASVVLGSSSVLTCLAGYKLQQLRNKGNSKVSISPVEWALGALPLVGLLFVQGPLCLLPQSAGIDLNSSNLAFLGGFAAAILTGVMWVVMPHLHEISPLPVITHTLALSCVVSGLKTFLFPEAVAATDEARPLPRLVTEVVLMALLGCVGQISVTRGCQLYQIEPLPLVPFATGLVCMLALDAVVFKEYLPIGPTVAVVVAVGATCTLIYRKHAK
ncbi:hypothetical protein DYB36_009318 [Aphanomyces astaci]|uniref:EamA domain-containing protein n=1 Tax=Aphanomyces astaci TaxID=112090 RepID=A0A396ZV13_APHAT|nr:hypothetical protein DYB36_009318 [Aphanomyces astaci]